MDIIVDLNNLPDYMKECITENFDDCGLFIDKKTGVVRDIKVFDGYKINIEKFKDKFIMISKDF